jgi:heme/copper-type cytochrome/quinol oxidase subunit 2
MTSSSLFYSSDINTELACFKDETCLWAGVSLNNGQYSANNVARSSEEHLYQIATVSGIVVYVFGIKFYVLRHYAMRR